MPTLESVARRWWSKLPPEVRRSRLLAGPKRVALRLLQRPPAAQPPAVGQVEPAQPQRVVRTLDELDEMLRMLDEAGKVSDDELRRGFTRFRMELRLDLPADPYSPEYRAKVFELYEWLHGSPYTPANEVSSFDVVAAADRPFPYATESPQTVGNHLIAVGHIIRTMNLAPRSRVLELGAGWGNTTLALAQMGHDVTAIDIEPNFVKLIETRADRLNAPVRVLQGDFSLIDTLDEQFDAVLFFECFHHAADHLGLLAGLDRVVAPGGRLVFAAEPITDSLRYPWCLRLDGESLWAIRTERLVRAGLPGDLLPRRPWRGSGGVATSSCAQTRRGAWCSSPRARRPTTRIARRPRLVAWGLAGDNEVIVRFLR